MDASQLFLLAWAGLIFWVLGRRLERDGKDDTTIAELNRFNWPRTLSITAQATVIVAMLMSAFATP